MSSSSSAMKSIWELCSAFSRELGGIPKEIVLSRSTYNRLLASEAVGDSSRHRRPPLGKYPHILEFYWAGGVVRISAEGEDEEGGDNV